MSIIGVESKCMRPGLHLFDLLLAPLRGVMQTLSFLADGQSLKTLVLHVGPCLRYNKSKQGGIDRYGCWQR